MDDILSVALAVFIGISIYKKFLKRMKSTKSVEQKPEDTPANYAEKIRQYKEKHSNRTLKKIPTHESDPKRITRSSK